MRRVGIIELLMGTSTFTCDGLNMCRLYLQVMVSSQTGAGLCRDGSDGHVCLTQSHSLAPCVQSCADNPRILKSVHPALLACSHEIYSPTFSAVTHKARIHHHAPS